MSPSFTLTGPGDLPLLVSVPHAGTELWPGMADRIGPEATPLPDTDWHLHEVYAFVTALGGRLLVPRYHRTVADLNRPADGGALYPGRAETTVVPTTLFSGEAIYSSSPPDTDEIERRIAVVWQPYHDALRTELAALKRRHGIALLFDGHSIRSEVPRFFEGRLEGFILGTNRGRACAPAIADAARAALAPHGPVAVDEPFRGGFITRHYGRPETGVHALQLEMAQNLYMVEDPPYSYLPQRAASLVPVLRSALEAAAVALTVLRPRS